MGALTASGTLRFHQKETEGHAAEIAAKMSNAHGTYGVPFHLGGQHQPAADPEGVSLGEEEGDGRSAVGSDSEQ